MPASANCQPGSGPAHDLRNMLAIVIANCELLITAEQPALDLPARIKTILDSTRRALGIADLMIVPDEEFIQSVGTVELAALRVVIQDELLRRSEN